MSLGAHLGPPVAVLLLRADQDNVSPRTFSPIPGDCFPDGPHLSGTSSKKQDEKNRAIFPPAYSLVGSGGFKNPKSLERFNEWPATAGG